MVHKGQENLKTKVLLQIVSLKLKELLMVFTALHKVKGCYDNELKDPYKPRKLVVLIEVNDKRKLLFFLDIVSLGITKW